MLSITIIFILILLIMFCSFNKFDISPSNNQCNTRYNNQCNTRFNSINFKNRFGLNIEGFELSSKNENTSLPISVNSRTSAFCKEHQNNPSVLEEHCAQLTAEACHIPSCCVLRDATHCVAGDHRGPTFHGTDDNPIHTEFYHHRGECKNGRGECPE